MEVLVIFLIILAVASFVVYIISKKVDKKNGVSDWQPVSTYDEETPLLAVWIDARACYIMANIVNYLKSIGKSSKFDSSKSGDYVLEIITLILAFLKEQEIEIKEVWERKWLKQFSTNFGTSNAVNDNNISSLFEERIKFYGEELDSIKHSAFPIPNTIIYQMFNPMASGEISHKIPLDNGFDILENTYIWKIIIDEVSKLMGKISKHADIMYMSKSDEKKMRDFVKRM